MGERRRAQSALIASERRFRAVFDASTIGVIIADPEGRFLEVNDYVHAMLGFASGELIGKSFSDIVPDVEQHDETAGPAAGEAANSSVCHEMRSPPGSC